MQKSTTEKDIGQVHPCEEFPRICPSGTHMPAEIPCSHCLAGPFLYKQEEAVAILLFPCSLQPLCPLVISDRSTWEILNHRVIWRAFSAAGSQAFFSPSLVISGMKRKEINQKYRTHEDPHTLLFCQQTKSRRMSNPAARKQMSLLCTVGLMSMHTLSAGHTEPHLGPARPAGTPAATGSLLTCPTLQEHCKLWLKAHVL